MRRIVIILLFAMLCPLGMMAQSSMTDEQIMSYILKEHQNGRTQDEIAMRLVQRGVDVQQRQRVRKKMERLQKQQGLGATDDATSLGNGQNRQRQNNAQEKADPNGSLSSMRVQKPRMKKHTYDDQDDEYQMMVGELGGIMPVDSIAWLQQILDAQERDKKKIYGHDLFNNEMLSFEPNMNMATPKDYVIGPGDAVAIDIYGDTQKTIDYTVSPDGDIVIGMEKKTDNKQEN